jgi:hypothetical protein
MALPLLTQSELVEELAEETGWSKSDVRRFLDGLDAVITSNVSDGYRVKISGVVIGPVVRYYQRRYTANAIAIDMLENEISRFTADLDADMREIAEWQKANADRVKVPD